MLNLKKIEDLEDLILNERDFNLTINQILGDLTKQLVDASPKYNKIEFSFGQVENTNIFDPFSIGVNRKIEKDKISILVDKDHIKFISFIVLREMYNLFVPREIKKSESIQLIINQIIMTQLSSFKNINDWRKIIRGNLKQYDLLVTGFNYLIGYDRLEKFFRLSQKDSSKNMIKFFFNYLHRSKSLFKENRVYILNLFLNEFKNFKSESMDSEEMVESIKCIVDIFYKIQEFESILKFKEIFQQLKEEKILTTSLSLRRFEKNLNWINSNSMIAPTYQLQYKSINLYPISIFFEFNPLLSKVKIIEILKELPFFMTPKFFYNGFGLDIYGYMILPKYYLNDFLELIKKLENYNYIINYSCLDICNQVHCVNLNYFRDYAQNQRIIDNNYQKYEKGYEIQFKTDYGGKLTERKLELLDFLIFDLIRFFSYFSFGFEKRAKTLRTLKSDLMNEIISQHAIIKELKDSLQLFQKSNDLRNRLIRLIDKNRIEGFFFVKRKIENYVDSLKILEVFISTNPEINTISKFNVALNTKFNQFTINERKILKLNYIERSIIQNLVPSFFKSKGLYLQAKSVYTNFSKIFNSFYNLKIFNLNTIKDVILNQELIETMLEVKDNRLKEVYEKFKLYKMSGKLIDEKIRKFLSYKPPIIKPLLINTIITDQYVHNYLEIIIIESKESRMKLNSLKLFFPRFIILEVNDFFRKNKYLLVEISVPYLNSKEKGVFLSFIFTTFQDKLIKARFYIWGGMVSAFSSKNFYDFENEQFFYTPDLFKQYFLNVRTKFGEINCGSLRKTPQIPKFLFSEINSFSDLISLVNSKNFKKKEKINLKSFESLSNFQTDIIRTLIDDNKYNHIKSKEFFIDYVKHIYFIPTFQYFKLTQHYLYFNKSNLDLKKLKLILGNSFQKLRFSSSIEKTPSFLLSYVQKLESSDNIHSKIIEMDGIQDFCYFRVKRVCFLFDFQSNLTDEGWDYNKDYFHIHINKVLSNQILKSNNLIKDYHLYDENSSIYYDVISPEYLNLLKIYNWNPVDIKSFLLTKKTKTIQIIRDLISKDLIIPYISVKNVGFRDTLYFIIPNIKKQNILNLKRIFNFFNYGFIFEIEGDYKISGQDKINHFKDGLFIKLKLPNCQIGDFIQLIDLLFEDLNIRDYVILNNPINGSQLMKKMKTTTQC